MTGHDVRVQEDRSHILLRCEELKSHLEATKVRLNQAAFQLEELTRIMLAQKPSLDPITRPWLNELLFSQLIGDVIDAERRLTEARSTAAELGIPLPPDL